MISNKFKFSLNTIIQESHSQEIYSLKFCNTVSSFYNYFATVGVNRTTIYRINDEHVELVYSYCDLDEEELYYTCAWCTLGEENIPLLAVAGLCGAIKIINILKQDIAAILPGHGNSVNDLKVHPIDTNLLLSASKDESIRLWNIKNAVCIAIFNGEKGHRDDVLSIDIHPLGNSFISSGMDKTIRLWSLTDPELSTAIPRSYTHPTREGLPFQTCNIQYPIFSTNQIHTEYVDSVCFVGNLILSKSASNGKVALWIPDPLRYPVSQLLVHNSSNNTNFIQYPYCLLGRLMCIT